MYIFYFYYIWLGLKIRFDCEKVVTADIAKRTIHMGLPSLQIDLKNPGF